MTDIFKDGLLTIGPFHWSPCPWLVQYANASDQVIRSVRLSKIRSTISEPNYKKKQKQLWSSEEITYDLQVEVLQ